MSVFFPGLAFWGLAVGLVVITQSPAETIEAWGKQPVEVQALFIILFLAWVTFFAYLLANRLTALTRPYEGYWDWTLGHGRVAEPRRKQYQAELGLLMGESEGSAAQEGGLERRSEPENVTQNQEAIRAELENVLAGPHQAPPGIVICGQCGAPNEVEFLDPDNLPWCVNKQEPEPGLHRLELYWLEGAK